MTVKHKQLYRQAYFDAKKSNTDGAILISSNLNQTLYLIASLMVLLCIILFVTFGEYTRKAHLEGIVMPSSGIIKVESDIDGFVKKLLVKEGDFVTAGQALYQLDGERYDSFGSGMLAALTDSISKQYNYLKIQRQQEILMNSTKKNGLLARISQFNLELKSARVALSLAEQQAQLINTALTHLQSLFEKKFLSEQAYRQKQIEYAIAKGYVESSRQSLQRLTRELSTSESDLHYLELQGDTRLSEIDRQLQVIQQQKIEMITKSDTTITAPVSGTVATILVEPGQSVDINSRMLTLVPENAKLQVELFTPSRNIGFIKPQQKVGLRYSAFPYQKFGVQYGRVIKISRSSITTKDLLLRGPVLLKEGEAQYRIIVELDKKSVLVYGKEEVLMVGMTVSADVELDKRYLYEWLTEPLWSLQGKM